jgi:hypothetical protein
VAAEFPDGPIDAVYTWVDGDDPSFRESFSRALSRHTGIPAHADTGRHRYRDSHELRYSLRSISRHASWINHVYLVTNGQVPTWLNRSATGLTLVRHEEIFPNPGDLPTFNSHAIESCLHRIPGLSEAYVYFNDDVFIGRDAAPADFIEDGQTINYFDDLRMDSALNPFNPTDQAYGHTRNLVLSRYPHTSLSHLPAHVPRLFRKSETEWLEQAFADEFERTRGSPFRANDDFVLRIAHAALLQERRCPEHVLRNRSEDYFFLRLMPGIHGRWHDLRSIRRLRPRLLCINDELNESPGCRIVRALMVRCLERLFPVPSPFEARPAI